MRIAFALMLALASVAPALAQSPAPVVALAATDPARLAAAKPVIDKVWPLGTYRRVMKSMMDNIMDSTMSSMFGMKASDLAGMARTDQQKARIAAEGDKTLAELAAAKDPYFRERLRITMDVMMREMMGLMDKVEPQVREALTASYARQFDVTQLGELDRFFGTPTGTIYARESMLLFSSPEMTKAMQAFMPEFMRDMPGIMAKVQQATAHLPPPPKDETAQQERAPQ